MSQTRTAISAPAIALLLLFLPTLTWAQANLGPVEGSFTRTFNFGVTFSPAGERIDVHLVSGIPPASTDSVLPPSVDALVFVSSANADPFLMAIEDVFSVSGRGIETLSVYAVPAAGTESTAVALRVSTQDGTELGSPLVAPAALTLPEGGAATALFSAACDAAGSSCEILVDTGFGAQPLPGLVEPSNGRITLKVELDCSGGCPGGLASQTAVIGADGRTRAATHWNFTNAYPSKWVGPAL